MSRATMVRRIGDARTALHERLLGRVAAELGVGSREYHELLELVRSTLDVSLARLLREP